MTWNLIGISKYSTSSTKELKNVNLLEGQDPSERSLELLNSLKPKPSTKPKIVGLPPPPKPPSILMAKLMQVGQRVRIDLVAKSAHKAFDTVSFFFSPKFEQEWITLEDHACVLMRIIDFFFSRRSILNVRTWSGLIYYSYDVLCK